MKKLIFEWKCHNSIYILSLDNKELKKITTTENENDLSGVIDVAAKDQDFIYISERKNTNSLFMWKINIKTEELSKIDQGLQFDTYSDYLFSPTRNEITILHSNYQDILVYEAPSLIEKKRISLVKISDWENEDDQSLKNWVMSLASYSDLWPEIENFLDLVLIFSVWNKPETLKSCLLLFGYPDIDKSEIESRDPLWMVNNSSDVGEEVKILLRDFVGDSSVINFYSDEQKKVLKLC